VPLAAFLAAQLYAQRSAVGSPARSRVALRRPAPPRAEA
jgi:hypothetical protein